MYFQDKESYGLVMAFVLVSALGLLMVYLALRVATENLQVWYDDMQRHTNVPDRRLIPLPPQRSASCR